MGNHSLIAFGRIFVNIGPFGLIHFALELSLFCDLIHIVHTGNPSRVVENHTIMSTHVETLGFILTCQLFYCLDDYGSKWDGNQVSASYVLVGSEVEKFMSVLLVVQRTKINTVDGCGKLRIIVQY